MYNYRLVTGITEAGSAIIKIILEMPWEVSGSEIGPDYFHLFIRKRDAGCTEPLKVSNFFTGKETIHQGNVAVTCAYICDETGRDLAAVKGADGCQGLARSKFVALVPEESILLKRVEGNVLRCRFLEMDVRVTLLKTISGDPMKSGLVWDEFADEYVPQLNGWKTVMDGRECATAELFTRRWIGPLTPYAENRSGSRFPFIVADVSEDMTLSYGYYDPKPDTRVPVVIWLHGAGEGGLDPKIPQAANMINNLSIPDYQVYFGGKAYVLVPQCPTVWMDDGVEQLGRSNKSIYVKPLKACIDEFIAAHSDTVDTDRIYISGMSNGGYMTVRMLIDYPEFFAAGVPVCEAFYSENIDGEALTALAGIPLWFVHSKKDELVPPFETAVPTYKRLKAAGAPNVHLTFYDQLFRDPNRFRDEFGRKIKGFSHAVWNYVLNNECRTEFDGTLVMEDGAPVTIWEWVGMQRKRMVGIG